MNRTSPSREAIHPGIWRLRVGTPVTLRRIEPEIDGLAALGKAACPFADGEIAAWRTARGCRLSIPVDGGEHLYGLGLLLLSFEQTGRKKMLRVNSDPKADLGDSHAPVPLYVSTGGYGILIDTLRYARFTWN